MKTPELLAAEAECRALVLRAVEAVDSGDAMGFSALFLPDGVLVRPDGSVLHGPGEIGRAYAARDPDRQTQHLICNHVVELDEVAGSALSRCKVLLWSTQRSAPLTPLGRRANAMAQVGEFLDVMQNTPDGWRIRSRKAEFILYCD
ncbi:nuclear transport factor 2 family protein [Rhodoferax sp.]|uniref:nuclear transport factor 2 family protein n=1 Tax=Rhodoferax sp. TaxID=50421 RepID=UPI0026144741|nr:nuclear transport factor 2 family protein [Rhodoferax sp.]MDD2925404.1 nuclear transport factor 2 family protein [Rhodoferax sp.]